MILDIQTHKLLIDCGRTVPETMKDHGYNWHDFDAVYISHEHSDHAGGLEEFAFMRYFVPGGKRKPWLYGNQNMLNNLWEHTLKGGLEFAKSTEYGTLSTYFDVVGMPLGGGFYFGRIDFRLIKSVHVTNAYGEMPSYGLAFETPNKKVFITTDSCFQPLRLMSEYQKADIIFQDCETGPYQSGVHAHYKELQTLPDEIRAKMVLVHYNDVRPQEAKADGFMGFAEKGQVFDL